MSDQRNASSGANPESTWNGTKIVRITGTDGANLWADRSMDSAVIRHYGEGHSLPVNSFMVTRRNGDDWYQVEAYNGHGIGYVTEDRKNAGIFASMSVRENLTASILKTLSSLGIISAEKEQALLDKYTKSMNMKYATPAQPISGLSGGNQQKFVLSRALATDCHVLILLEPTRGIDVGAKSEIYDLLKELAQNGMAILMVSSELAELIANCHRIAVIFQGRQTGLLQQDDFDQELIMQCATGNRTFGMGGNDHE